MTTTEMPRCERHADRPAVASLRLVGRYCCQECVDVAAGAAAPTVRRSIEYLEPCLGSELLGDCDHRRCGYTDCPTCLGRGFTGLEENTPEECLRCTGLGAVPLEECAA